MNMGGKAEHNMKVLNGRSVININIKCVILMYMSDNWILNYPSIKNRIYSARKFSYENNYKGKLSALHLLLKCMHII